MIINLLLIIDFVMLAVVVSAYIYASLKERKYLREKAGQSLELQQKVYQSQVLKEISERIGYSLDTSKIVDIITSSLANLLDYDTVSSLVLDKEGHVILKCHVENAVNHDFIDEVKEKVFKTYEAILDKPIDPSLLDESLTGNILDDSLHVNVESYFNLPVVISDKLVCIINVASARRGKYGYSEASILYTVINQASTAVSKLEAVLESEKGKLSAIIYSLTDGVITVDLNNQLGVFNPVILDILQIKPEANKPVSMFDVIDSLAGKVDLRTKIEQAIAQNKTITLPEVLLKDKALEMTISPVKDNQGKIISASVLFHDVTTEKSLEKLRQEFTAMMVHELRAPLTAVRWSSESLLKNVTAASGVDAAKVKDTMMTIETASNNMLELVNDLLDVAKIEAGRFELNPQVNDLAEVMREQAKTFTPQAETKHLAININVPEKLPLKFDRVRISQVMGNLISNAIKYTDAGQIDLSVTQDKEKVVVGVKDSGIGVAREDLNQLFSKFKQLQTGDRARKGTGLGLVVTKGIVEAHGGKIWAESAGENLGSTFYFSLPLNKS